VACAPGLLDKVRRQLVDNLGGYVQATALEPGAESYLVAPELGDKAGICGAFELARRATSTSP